MGDEAKAVRAKQTGMALEMDVIKKITHQLERLPNGHGAGQRIMQFVIDWVNREKLPDMGPPSPTGQLPLAAKDGFPE